MNFIFAAEHQGPLQTLIALAAASPSHNIKIVTPSSTPKSVDETVRSLKLDAVIIGTSETFDKPSIEDEYGRIATQTGIPVFYVEDFPLNYHPRPDILLSGLFVEFPRSAERYKTRGVDPDKIFEWGNPRYAALSSVDLTAPV